MTMNATHTQKNYLSLGRKQNAPVTNRNDEEKIPQAQQKQQLSKLDNETQKTGSENLMWSDACAIIMTSEHKSVLEKAVLAWKAFVTMKLRQILPPTPPEDCDYEDETHTVSWHRDFERRRQEEQVHLDAAIAKLATSEERLRTEWEEMLEIQASRATDDYTSETLPATKHTRVHSNRNTFVVAVPNPEVRENGNPPAAPNKNDEKKTVEEKKIVEENHRTKEREKHDAATCIQAKVRGNKARKESKEIKTARDAATRIQARARGNNVRKELSRKPRPLEGISRWVSTSAVAFDSDESNFWKANIFPHSQVVEDEGPEKASKLQDEGPEKASKTFLFESGGDDLENMQDDDKEHIGGKESCSTPLWHGSSVTSVAESAMKSELEGKSLHCEMSRESNVNEFEEVDGFTGEVSDWIPAVTTSEGLPAAAPLTAPGTHSPSSRPSVENILHSASTLANRLLGMHPAARSGVGTSQDFAGEFGTPSRNTSCKRNKSPPAAPTPLFPGPLCTPEMSWKGGQSAPDSLQNNAKGMLLQRLALGLQQHQMVVSHQYRRNAAFSKGLIVPSLSGQYASSLIEPNSMRAAMHPSPFRENRADPQLSNGRTSPKLAKVSRAASEDIFTKTSGGLGRRPEELSPSIRFSNKTSFQNATAEHLTSPFSSTEGVIHEIAIPLIAVVGGEKTAREQMDKHESGWQLFSPQFVNKRVSCTLKLDMKLDDVENVEVFKYEVEHDVARALGLNNPTQIRVVGLHTGGIDVDIEINSDNHPSENELVSQLIMQSQDCGSALMSGIHTCRTVAVLRPDRHVDNSSQQHINDFVMPKDFHEIDVQKRVGRADMPSSATPFLSAMDTKSLTSDCEEDLRVDLNHHEIPNKIPQISSQKADEEALAITGNLSHNSQPKTSAGPIIMSSEMVFYDEDQGIEPLQTSMSTKVMLSVCEAEPKSLKQYVIDNAPKQQEEAVPNRAAAAKMKGVLNTSRETEKDQEDQSKFWRKGGSQLSEHSTDFNPMTSMEDINAWDFLGDFIPDDLDGDFSGMSETGMDILAKLDAQPIINNLDASNAEKKVAIAKLRTILEPPIAAAGLTWEEFLAHIQSILAGLEEGGADATHRMMAMRIKAEVAATMRGVNTLLALLQARNKAALTKLRTQEITLAEKDLRMSQLMLHQEDSQNQIKELESRINDGSREIMSEPNKYDFKKPNAEQLQAMLDFERKERAALETRIALLNARLEESRLLDAEKQLLDEKLEELQNSLTVSRADAAHQARARHLAEETIEQMQSRNAEVGQVMAQRIKSLLQQLEDERKEMRKTENALAKTEAKMVRERQEANNHKKRLELQIQDLQDELDRKKVDVNDLQRERKREDGEDAISAGEENLTVMELRKALNARSKEIVELEEQLVECARELIEVKQLALADQLERSREREDREESESEKTEREKERKQREEQAGMMMLLESKARQFHSRQEKQKQPEVPASLTKAVIPVIPATAEPNKCDFESQDQDQLWGSAYQCREEIASVESNGENQTWKTVEDGGGEQKMLERIRDIARSILSGDDEGAGPRYINDGSRNNKYDFESRDQINELESRINDGSREMREVLPTIFLRLGIDFQIMAGTLGSTTRAVFEYAFKRDLTRAVGCRKDGSDLMPPDYFTLKNVDSENLIVETEILSHPFPGMGPDPWSVAANFHRQQFDPDSMIRKGVLTKHLISITYNDDRSPDVKHAKKISFIGSEKNDMSSPYNRSVSPKVNDEHDVSVEDIEKDGEVQSESVAAGGNRKNDANKKTVHVQEDSISSLKLAESTILRLQKALESAESELKQLRAVKEMVEHHAYNVSEVKCRTQRRYYCGWSSAVTISKARFFDIVNACLDKLVAQRIKFNTMQAWRFVYSRTCHTLVIQTLANNKLMRRAIDHFRNLKRERCGEEVRQCATPLQAALRGAPSLKALTKSHVDTSSAARAALGAAAAEDEEDNTVEE